MQAMREQMEKITFAPPLISTTNVTVGFCGEAWRSYLRAI